MLIITTLAILPMCGHAQNSSDSTSIGLIDKKNLDSSRVRLIESMPSTTIITADGKKYNGVVLLAADSILILRRAGTQFPADALIEPAVAFVPASIDSIVVHHKDQSINGGGYGFLLGGLAGVFIGLRSGDDADGFLKLTAGTKALLLGAVAGGVGFVIGAVVGGIGSAYDRYVIHGNMPRYLTVLPDITANSLFVRSSSHDIVSSISAMNDTIIPITVYANRTIRTLSPSFGSHPKFHITIGVTVRLTRPGRRDITKAFDASGFGGRSGGFFGTVTYPVDHGTPFSWEIAGSYEIIDRLDVGVGVHRFSLEDINGKDQENESAHGTSYRFSAEYIPLESDVQLGRHSEMSLGIGVTYNTLSVDGTISSLFGIAYAERPVHYTAQNNSPGLFMSATYDYYLTQSASFCFSLEGNFLHAVNVPAVGFTNPYSNDQKYLMPHSVEFSGLDISIGIRYHI